MAAMPSARDVAGLIAATGWPATDKVPESGGDGTGHHLDQRRLSRAVLADERVNLPFVEIE